ncbi:MAG: transcription factor S, partial [Thermofilaceae archaeon]
MGALKPLEMEYCPSCGNLLLPRRKDGQVVIVCQRCGYEKTVSNPSAYRVTRQARHGPGDTILVIDHEVSVETLPKAKVECPRCGHLEAYYWEAQTRAGDEPATRFFRCVKCGYTW